MAVTPLRSCASDVHLHAAATTYGVALLKLRCRRRRFSHCLRRRFLCCQMSLMSKFYVRSAYKKIWDCITRTEGKLRLQILAACYQTPVANMKLIMQFCCHVSASHMTEQAVQMHVLYGKYKELMPVCACKPNSHHRYSRNRQDFRAAFILQQLSQQDCIVVVKQLSKIGLLLTKG